LHPTMNTNTANSQSNYANDGTAHKPTIGEKIHDMLPGGNKNHNNQAGVSDSHNGNSPLTSGSHSHTTHTVSDPAYGLTGQGHQSTGTLGQTHQSGLGQTHQSGLGQTHQSGLGQTGQTGQYRSNDGDLHNSKVAAQFDNVTPGSSSQHNNAQYTGTGQHNQGLDSIGSNRGVVGTGHTAESQHVQGQQGQYMSNDGDLHKSKMAAKADDLTPSKNQSGHNTHSTSGLGQTEHGYASSGVGATGYGAGDRTHMSNDGDLHNSAAGAKVDSATPSSNTTGHHNSTTTGHNTTAAGHGNATASGEKVGMGAKLSGMMDKVVGGMTGDKVKAEHGAQVSQGILPPKSDKHTVL